jgi:putative transcriptional regulator
MPSSLVSRTCIATILSCQGRLTSAERPCKACLTVRNDVRLLRTARDLSQGALADALGVSRQTINAIETGRYLPSLPLAFGLARFFETTVEQIFHPDSEEITT